MKKITFTLMLFLTLGLIFGSGLSAKMIHIGEAQIVAHPALDNDSKGFAAALAEEGFIEGKNITIDRQNAQGDQPTCAIIAQKFEDDRVDLVHAISTPNAQAQVKVSKTIPIVFSSVTDPVATGIVPKMGKTGIHITGVSDRWPITLQCKMYQDLVPLNLLLKSAMRTILPFLPVTGIVLPGERLQLTGLTTFSWDTLPGNRPPGYSKAKNRAKFLPGSHPNTASGSA